MAGGAPVDPAMFRCTLYVFLLQVDEPNISIGIPLYSMSYLLLGLQYKLDI